MDPHCASQLGSFGKRLLRRRNEMGGGDRNRRIRCNGLQRRRYRQAPEGRLLAGFLQSPLSDGVQAGGLCRLAVHRNFSYGDSRDETGRFEETARVDHRLV